jgi:hypothetical protein
MPTNRQLDLVSSELADMQELLDEFPELPEDGPEWTTADNAKLTPAGGAYLRGIRHLLNEIDGFRSYGSLERVQASSGEILWVCEEHAAAYNPGLPVIN